jgi:hypothetical protein
MAIIDPVLAARTAAAIVSIVMLLPTEIRFSWRASPTCARGFNRAGMEIPPSSPGLEVAFT